MADQAQHHPVKQKVHYRRFDRDKCTALPSDKSLFAAVVEATEFVPENGVRVLDDAEHRLQQNADGTSLHRLWNNWILDNAPSAIFGNLCVFRPDEYLALIRRSGSAAAHSAYDLLNSEAPRGTDYLHAIGYWMITGDHMFTVQAAAVQNNVFESYFSWLLSKCNVIEDGAEIVLKKRFDIAEVGENLDDLSTLRLGSTLEPAAAEDEPQLVTTTTEAREFLGRARVLGEALERALGAENYESLMERFRAIQEDDPSAALDVALDIAVKTRKQSTRDAKRNLMMQIERGLRNVPDTEICAIGKNGKIVGETAFVHRERTFQAVHERSPLLDLNQAFQQFKNVYDELNNGGII